MKIEAQGKRLVIRNCLNFKARLRAVPGFNKWEECDLILEASRANIEWLHAEFPAAEWSGQAGEVLDSLHAMKRREDESLNVPLHIDAGDHLFKTEPYRHQLEAWHRSKEMAVFGYFMEMGTGKTKVLIDNIAWLWHNNKIDGVLYLSPNGVHRQFIKSELPKHMPEDVQYTADFYASGGKAQEKRRRARFLSLKTEKLKILSANIESLSSSSGFGFCEAFLKSFTPPGKGPVRRVMIVVDESTRIKNMNSNRTKAAFKLRVLCAYARILSGSPITRGVEDFYPQMSFLSTKILGYTSKYTFKNRYVITEKAGKDDQYEVVIGYQNLEELTTRLAPYVHRVTKEECLDLPPKLYIRREVAVSIEQKEAYNKLSKELELEFNEGHLTVTAAAAKIVKLQQILCGFVKLSDGKIVRFNNVPRLDEVYDIVSFTEGQLVIWARFTEDVDRLLELLKEWPCVRYDAKVSSEAKEKAKQDFLHKRARIFVGKAASGGIGINELVKASNVIYYSNSYDAEHRWQSEDRNHRLGMEGQTTYYDLVCPGSVDEDILSNLQAKKNIETLTISDLRKMLRTIE